jgi:hypothetical protein
VGLESFCIYIIHVGERRAGDWSWMSSMAKKRRFLPIDFVSLSIMILGIHGLGGNTGRGAPPKFIPPPDLILGTPPRNFWEALAKRGLPKEILLGASQNCHFIGSPLFLTLAGWHPAKLAVGRSIIFLKYTGHSQHTARKTGFSNWELQLVFSTKK